MPGKCTRTPEEGEECECTSLKKKKPQRCFPGDKSRLIYFADDAFIAGEPPNTFLNRRMLMPYISKPTPPRRRGVSTEFPLASPSRATYGFRVSVSNL